MASFSAALLAVASESAVGALLPGASLWDSWLLYLAAFVPAWLALWLFAIIIMLWPFGRDSIARDVVQIATLSIASIGALWFALVPTSSGDFVNIGIVCVVGIAFAFFTASPRARRNED